MTRKVFDGKLKPEFNPFDDDYLAEILETAAVAWDRMNHPDAGEIEDKITNRLAGRILNDPHFAQLPYDVIAQCCLLGIEGEQLGRLDLRFKHRYSQRDYFAFEAKRLHVTYPNGRFSPEYPAYAGSEGMMAFVEGQYSAGYRAGGMLGYIMDGKTEPAWNGLGLRIDNQRTSLKLVEESQLTASSCSAASKGMTGTLLGETDHDLQTHRLRLFHLLLPVQNGRQGKRLRGLAERQRG